MASRLSEAGDSIMPGNAQHIPSEAAMYEPIVLRSGAHTWCFRCERGQEGTLLKEFARLARDPSAPFDWFDAALATRELARLRARTPAHTNLTPVHIPHSPSEEMQP